MFQAPTTERLPPLTIMVDDTVSVPALIVSPATVNDPPETVSAGCAPPPDEIVRLCTEVVAVIVG